MAIWSIDDFSGQFHSEPEETRLVDDGLIDEVNLSTGDPIAIPGPRRQVMEAVHRELRRSWVTGGVVFQAYELEEPDAEVEADDPGPEAVISLLWSLADNQDLPSNIAGCSIAWLAEGKIWPESMQQFGDALYRALRDGGVLGDGLAEDHAERMTTEYMDALFGEAEESDVFLFGLDPGFSCWFCDGEYDIAYAIINLDSGWFGLFLATDSED